MRCRTASPALRPIRVLDLWGAGAYAATMAEPESFLERIVTMAARFSADGIEIEYRDGHEEIFAMRGDAGLGLARLPGSGREAKALCEELRRTTRHKRRLTVDGCEYELRVQAFESFGEQAYHVTLSRIEGRPPGAKRDR